MGTLRGFFCVFWYNLELSRVASKGETMPKVRANRIVRDWQSKTQMRSHSGILAAKNKMFSPVIEPHPLTAQLHKAEANYKKLEKEIERLKTKVANAPANSDQKKKLEWRLKVRREKYSKLWYAIWAPGGLVSRAQAEQKRDEKRKEKVAKEMQEAQTRMENADKALQKGLKVIDDTPFPAFVKQRIDTVGGKRRLVAVKEKTEIAKRKEKEKQEDRAIPRKLVAPYKGAKKSNRIVTYQVQQGARRGVVLIEEQNGKRKAKSGWIDPPKKEEKE